VGVAVESRAAIAVATGGDGDSVIPVIFRRHAACGGGGLCYATAEFQPAMAVVQKPNKLFVFRRLNMS